MKRIVLFLLVLAMVLTLTACGAEKKSAAVRKTEAMISAMGEVSLSNPAIKAVQEQVASLTEEERALVENIGLFDASWVEYLTLRMLEVGAWSYPSIDYTDVEEQLENPDLTLLPDGTFVCPRYAPDGGASWSVTADAMLLLTDVNGSTERFSLDDRDGVIYVDNWAPHAQVVEKIQETILVVDVNNENWTEYMEFFILEREQRDLFGEPVGYTEAILMLRSKLYEEGWVCYDASDNFLFQVFIPQHGINWYKDGEQGTGSGGNYSPDYSAVPFGCEIYHIRTMDSGGRICESLLTLDDIQMVGIRGKLYYIREECVTGYSYRDDIRIIEVGSDEIADWWYVEGNEY